MLPSDLGSFPKGTIKMPRRFFVRIFGGIESAFRSSCKFSKKNFRYLSFACPKLRQIALLLSTLPLVLKPAQCCPAQSMSRSERPVALIPNAGQRHGPPQNRLLSKNIRPAGGSVFFPYRHQNPTFQHMLSLLTTLPSFAAAIYQFTPYFNMNISSEGGIT